MFFPLLAELRTVLADRLAGLPGKVPLRAEEWDGAMAAPRVFIGWLPPKTKDSAGEPYPFALLRSADAAVYPEFSVVGVRMLFGVFAGGGRDQLEAAVGEAAEHYALNMVSRTCLELSSRRVVGGRFELVPDERDRLFTWRIMEEQAPPYAVAVMDSRWRVPGATQLLEDL